MFRVLSLRLTNFRGFEELDLTFEPDLTVLVGVNGSGKSSVLSAITLPLLRRLQGNFLAPGHHVRSGAAMAEVELVAAFDSGPVPFGVRLLGGRKIELSTGPRSLSAVDPSSSVVFLLVYGVQRNASDKTPGSTAGESWAPTHAHEGWFDAGASYERFFLWFREMEDLENEALRDGRPPPPQLAAVRAAVERTLGVSNLRVRRQFEPFSKKPILTVDKEGVTLPFDALSEGERALVALVADIARRLALKNPGSDALEGEAVVLIDEIELHLHPALQRTILARLREVFPNVQWITTTHSPIVASELEGRHLRVLESFRLREVGHGRGREIDAILREVFDTSARPAAVEARFASLVDALDERRLDEARRVLEELETSIGEDSDLVYYRAILERLAS